MSALLPAADKVLSIGELTRAIKGKLEESYASVWVEGEISNFKQAASGHWYFTVRDEGAQLRSTCFRGVNARGNVRAATTAPAREATAAGPEAARPRGSEC